MSSTIVFDEKHVLHELKHYLPSQAPLKDFIHHNTLHAFQHHKFHDGLKKASAVFGYKVYMKLDDYRVLYNEHKINDKIFHQILKDKKGKDAKIWEHRLLAHAYDKQLTTETGKLRDLWKSEKRMNLDKDVQPVLYRLIGNYLDQGISIDDFPVDADGLMAAVRKLDRESFGGIFKSKRVKNLLHKHLNISDLLEILVGNEKYYERYIFEQQFSHPGWSGMVAVLEDHSDTLLKKKKITLRDFIFLELLMEIESLDLKFGDKWTSLDDVIPSDLKTDIFEAETADEFFEVLALWQEIFEWSYYDQFLAGIIQHKNETVKEKSFQAIFCIDDRECSFRRYIEEEDKNAETFSTAGFFNVEFYYQPEHGKYFTKSCPAPLTPEFLIKETGADKHHKKDAHFSRHNSGLIGGILSSSTLGFLSGLEMVRSIFAPTETPVIVAAKNHMHLKSKLTIKNKSPENTSHHLQIGFTTEEMADRMETLLNTIGMVKDFADLVYIVGHGASSVNNTHYAGYDCGACSGRAGSVNARVAAFMLNDTAVRMKLFERNISIPDSTQFIGVLHDTTRDEILYYDLDLLAEENIKSHIRNARKIEKALHENAKERARRFLMIESEQSAEKVHQQVKLRSLSLFEPRPEWNHATNCLCVVGKREITKHLFLDRRAFLQSYDYTLDPTGKYLLGILKAIAPVCGGINLEYYFSRNDNYRLGAGTKLPHNVMGLIGVANGMDGDLRTGLPFQMINIHDPLRLMVLVNHYPEAVLEILKSHPPTYEWFLNEWIHLTVLHPETNELQLFSNGKFVHYHPTQKVMKADKLDELIEKEFGNLNVMEL